MMAREHHPCDRHSTQLNTSSLDRASQPRNNGKDQVGRAPLCMPLGTMIGSRVGCPAATRSRVPISVTPEPRPSVSRSQMEPQEGKDPGQKNVLPRDSRGSTPDRLARELAPPWLFPNVWHRGKTLDPAIIKLGLPMTCIAKNVLPRLFFSGILAKHSGERPAPSSSQNCRWEGGTAKAA
jgi:hypothetical protein